MMDSLSSMLLNNTTLVLTAGGGLIVLLVISWLAIRLRPKRLDTAKFKIRWQEVQGLCRKAETWPLAVINADKLLDDALKLRKHKGKTMGERLVSAQRQLSNNDSVWFGHKLRNKLVHEEVPQLQKKEVQTALQGLRQALRDLGALE